MPGSVHATVDEKLRQLLAELPDAPPRSKLEPHVDLIRQLRRKRLTYRQIAAFLETHAELSVHWTTIHSFLKVRARHRCDVLRPKYEMSLAETAVTPSTRPLSQGEEVRARVRAPIAARQTAQEQEPPKRFEYTSGEPLTLLPPDTVTKCARPSCGHSRAQHDHSSSRACIQCYCQGWMEPQKSS